MPGTNPRSARIAALIQRVIASSMESQLHDKRLQGVTITEVRVTNDMQIARVYWTFLGDQDKEEGQRKRAQQALNQAAKGKLRSLVGARAGLRLTPQLQFIYDEVPEEAHEIEDILAVAHKRDEELALAREQASYAGEADPYRHDDEAMDVADTDAEAASAGASGTEPGFGFGTESKLDEPGEPEPASESEQEGAEAGSSGDES
ncbi:ribosome-binding factor A [Bifidobacterium aemilianum]|uniref:Ribosome-binding factor A n=1 Tax=Bifidobacterium aemilianum TaxID=2493120 RepID=A0A366K721_9BIFI|nr:30S ribosome-binding factor RbfA [Bifidobacterium aemilianum]RBP97535.1 ribosome-binding factor A [Bifidobacterium aemilianum]